MPNLIALTVVSQSRYQFELELDFSAVLKIGFLKEQQDQIFQEIDKVRQLAQQLHHIMDPGIERAQVQLHYCQQFCREIQEQEAEWNILNTRTRLFPWSAESRITYFDGRPVATLVRGRFEF